MKVKQILVLIAIFTNKSSFKEKKQSWGYIPGNYINFDGKKGLDSQNVKKNF